MIEVPRPDIVEESEESLGELPSGAERPIFHHHSAAPNGASAAQRARSANGREPVVSSSEEPFVFDAISGVVLAPDPQSFLLGLIGALARTARTPGDGESSLGIILRHLGDALDEELDEEAAFQNLVPALERRRFGKHALNEAVPVVAAFLARVLSEPILQATPGTTPAEIPDLVSASCTRRRSALLSVADNRSAFRRFRQ